jgi:hypothetical protein
MSRPRCRLLPSVVVQHLLCGAEECPCFDVCVCVCVCGRLYEYTCAESTKCVCGACVRACVDGVYERKCVRVCACVCGNIGCRSAPLFYTANIRRGKANYHQRSCHATLCDGTTTTATLSAFGATTVGVRVCACVRACACARMPGVGGWANVCVCANALSVCVCVCARACVCVCVRVCE